MSKPGFLEGRAEARRLRDKTIAELRICRMAAALQASIISFIVVSASIAAYPNAPAISVVAAVFVLAYATWALVQICRLGVFMRSTIAALGLFLEGRHADAVRLFDLAKDESA